MSLSTRELSSISIPFFIAVGACYLFGYWGAIDVNVLEFIGFADVAKLAVYPLIASLAFAALGVLFSELTTGQQLPVGGGEHTSIGKFGRKHARPLLATLLVVMVLIYIFGTEPFKWFAIAFLALVFAAPISHFEAMTTALPNPKLRFFLLQAAIALPLLAFAFGRSDMYAATKLATAKTVDVARSKLPLISEPKLPVVYLGLLGSTFVLKETKSGQVVFVKQRDDAPLFVVPRGGA